MLYANLAGIWTNISEIENVTVEQLPVSEWIEKQSSQIDHSIHSSQFQIIIK